MQNFMKTFGLTLAVALVAFGCQLKKADQAKTTAPVVKKSKAVKSPIPVGDSYTKGPADALVTIVEFSEFQFRKRAAKSDMLTGRNLLIRKDQDAVSLKRIFDS